MGVFENLPYTNFHELNLEWIVKKLKDLEAVVYGVDAVAPEAITVTNGPVSRWLPNGGWIYKYGRIVTAHIRLTVTDAVNLQNKILISGMPQPNDSRTVQMNAWGLRDYTQFIPLFVNLNSDGTITYAGEGNVTSTTYSLADDDTIVIDLTYIAKEE